MKITGFAIKLVLFAAVLAAAAVLFSCVQNTPVSDTDGTQADLPDSAEVSSDLPDSTEAVSGPGAPSKKEISDAALAALPESDFENANIIIVSSSRDTVIPESGESFVDRTKYERLAVLEEKFNCKFAVRYAADNTIYNEARTSENSGLYFADLVYTSDTYLWRYHAGSMALNISSLPFVNTGAPYFFAESMDAASFGGKTYAAAGASNMNPDNLACVFFNKEKAAELDPEALYSYVYKKTWTLEKMTALSKAAAYTSDMKPSGINGTVSSLGRDNLIQNLYYSANGTNVSSSRDSLPLYTEFDETAQLCADAIYSLLYEKNGYRNIAGADAVFSGGDSLFFIGYIKEKNSLPENLFDWGILPLPMYSDSESSDYRSMAGGGFPVTIVLSKTPDLTRSGILLEALNAAMYGYVRDMYYEECMYYIVRDNDTLNMIETIENGAALDFAHMFAGGVRNLAACTYDAAVKSVTTANNLDYYDRLGGNLNNLLAALAK